MSLVKKPFQKIVIPPDDPVFKFEYNFLYLKDKELRKKLYIDFKTCSAYFKKKG
jgi:hypothetical protein